MSVDILLVDDSQADVRLALRAIGNPHASHHVEVARDGEEALEYLFRNGRYAGRSVESLPRVVLLDLKLPKVDGFEVLRELRRNPATMLLPVIVLTSSNQERDVQEAYGLGANSYIQKPVDFDMFRETMRKITDYWLRCNLGPPSGAQESETA